MYSPPCSGWTLDTATAVFSLSLLPPLTASSMMVARRPGPSAPEWPVVAGEAGGETAEWVPGRGSQVMFSVSDDDLCPECGKRLEREREAATAPHS